MLVLEGVHSGYTQIDVLHGLSIEVPDGGFVGVLGPNGAGKTAMMRAISGLNPVRRGSIRFEEQELASRTPSDMVRMGVVQVPQGRMLFGSMSVRENLEMGAFLQTQASVVAEQLLRVEDLFPILRERADQPAAYLSGGEQQMLALGRALMGKPRLLLLDEPSLGLAPKIFDLILDRVCEIHASGTSILIAEQNARKVLRRATHCYVLEAGKVAFDGPAAVLANDPRIEQTYLGGGH